MHRPITMLVAIALLAAACGGDDGAEDTTSTTAATTTTAAETTTTAQATTTTAAPTTTTTIMEPAIAEPIPYDGPVAPLTGLPLEDPALAERRVLAVKIDNHPNARPQSGLLASDGVIEILVEGGFTRFIALFHTTDVDEVGPVRSARPTDSTVLRALGATMAISGGQPWIVGLTLNRGVPVVGEGEGTFRVSRRLAPHNLYASTSALRDVADARGYDDEFAGPLYEVAPWGALPEPADDDELGVAGDDDGATDISLFWASGHRVSWEYEEGQYLRSVTGFEHDWFDPDGERQRIAVDVLVVLTGTLYTAGPGAGTRGSAVPATETTGTGEVFIFYRGTVTRGTWERDSIEEPFSLFDESGDSLTVPPGLPWISVFPAGRLIAWS